MAIPWYAVVAGLVLVLVLPGGHYFFAAHGRPIHDVAWQLGWALLVVATACNLLISPLLSLIEGCGLVAEVASMRTGQGVISSCLSWIVLACHGGLLAPAVLAGSQFCCALAWVLCRHWLLVLDLIRFGHEDVSIDWRQEVWPFQWKIAVSWISGYFIFQLFTPVLFAYRGAVVAGQMGMSLQAMGGVFNVSLAWLSTKAAPFGRLVAKRSYDQMDSIFFRTVAQAVSIAFLGFAVLWSGAYALHAIHHPWSRKILDPVCLLFLVVASMVNVLVNAQAVYLRAHKEEPFMALSVLGACLCALSALVLGRYYGALGVCVGYASSSLIGLGFGTSIFMRKRRLWHHGVNV
jgi:hypothetical protein